MVNKISAKNIEIYIGNINTDAITAITGRANSTTLASVVQAEKTGGDITNWLKISNGTTEVNIEPEEDDFETENFFGVDENGTQNSISSVTYNGSATVTLTKADEIINTLKKYMLASSGITNTTVDDYQAYNWGSMSSSDIILVIRKKKLISGVYHMGTIVVLQPRFTKPAGLSGSSSDASINTEISLSAEKGKIYEDFYHDSVDETLANF